MSGNKNPSQGEAMSPEDTPMALLEQLVYMENFFQNDTPSAGVTSNTPDNNMMFNDQLQRELAAFADDTFIFPDEDKPMNNEGSSNDALGNQNRYMSPNTRNDLLSFAEATSFNHVSPSLSTNSSGGPIPAQTYQNLTQRYTNKRKYDYHDAMQNNNNTAVRSVSNANNPPNMLPSNTGDQNKQKKGNAKISDNNSNNNNHNTAETENNNSLSAPPIPSTIHELLGKAPATANRTMFASPNFPRGVQDISPNLVEQQHQMRQPNIPQIPSARVHVPQGAQNTLSAAGLSQTQIDALASLVAFHKPEVYDNNQPQVGGLAANPAIYQSQSFLSQSGRNNSGASTITAGTGTPIPPMFNQIPMTPQPMQQQQQQQQHTPQIQQLQPSNNSLLVNLLAQTLANAVQPQQQNLLTDLVVALSKSQTQAQNNVPLSSPGALDSLHMLTSANVPQIPHPLTTATSNTTPTGNPQQHSRLGSVSNQSTSSLDQLHSMDSFASPSSIGSKPKKKKENNNKITNTNFTPAVKVENTGDKVGDSEEEKRQRVTAASARFRQKKKMKEQEMEKSLQEAQDLSKVLDSRIQQLEMENRLLRNLVVEKSQRRDEQEVERLRKKAKIEAQNKEKNANN